MATLPGAGRLGADARGHTGTAEIDAAATRALTPNLSPEVVRRVLGRTVYTETEEHEAELLASLIDQRVRARMAAELSGVPSTSS